MVEEIQQIHACLRRLLPISTTSRKFAAGSRGLKSLDLYNKLQIIV